MSAQRSSNGTPFRLSNRAMREQLQKLLAGATVWSASDRTGQEKDMPSRGIRLTLISRTGTLEQVAQFCVS